MKVLFFIFYFIFYVQLTSADEAAFNRTLLTNEKIFEILKGTKFEKWGLADNNHCRMSWEENFNFIVKEDVVAGYYRLRKGQKLNFRCLANTIVVKSDDPLQQHKDKKIYQVYIFKDISGQAHVYETHVKYPIPWQRYPRDGYSMTRDAAQALGGLFVDGSAKEVANFISGTSGSVSWDSIKKIVGNRSLLSFKDGALLNYETDLETSYHNQELKVYILPNSPFRWGPMEFNAGSVVVTSASIGLVVLPKKNKVKIRGVEIENVGAIDAKVVGEFLDMESMKIKFVGTVADKKNDFRKQTITAVSGYSASEPAMPHGTSLQFFREQLTSAILNSNIDAYGLNLPIGTLLYFDNDEQLVMCRLGKSLQVGNVVWPPGSALTFHNSHIQYIVSPIQIKSSSILPGQIYQIVNGVAAVVERPYVKTNESLYNKDWYGLKRLKAPLRRIDDFKFSIEPFDEFTVSPIVTVLGKDQTSYAIYSGKSMYCPMGADLADCKVEVEYRLPRAVEGLYGVFPRPFKISNYARQASSSYYTLDIDGVSAKLTLPLGPHYYPLKYQIDSSYNWSMSNEYEDHFFQIDRDK